MEKRKLWFFGVFALTLVSSLVLISEGYFTLTMYSVPPPPTLPEFDPWVTKQQCHSLADESEFCVYDGPICVAGDEVIYVSTTHGDQESDDRIMASCTDFRFWEREDRCYGYMGPFIRYNPPTEGIEQTIQDGEIRSVTQDQRVWGPDMRIVQVSDIPRNVLVKTFLDSLSLNSTSIPTSWLKSAFQTPSEELDNLPSAGSLLHPQPPNPWKKQALMPDKVSWLNGSMYVLPIAGAWDQHLWHFGSAAFQLFAIKRENLTRDTTTYAPRGTSHLPPMDYLVIPGAYDKRQNVTEGFASWIQMLFPFFTQSHTKIITNGPLGDIYGLNKTNWVCAPRGVLPGIKPRFFTGVGDAYAFRSAAYSMVGITDLAWPHYPPRKITVIDRKGASRWFYNRILLEGILNSTGLPYEFVQFTSDGPNQIKKMSETGILISAHGNAGTNAMFLPAHAVFIEVYPYLWLNNAFKNLALAVDASHISVFTTKPTREEIEKDPLINEFFPLVLTEDFEKHCEETPMNWLDSNLSVCNNAIKNSPVMLPIEDMKIAIRDAIRMIGCREDKDGIHCGCGFGPGGTCEHYRHQVPETPLPTPMAETPNEVTSVQP